MKKLITLVLFFLLLPSSILAMNMAEGFDPDLRDTQLNPFVIPKNISLERWIKNLPKGVKTETLKNINPKKIGQQTGQVEVTFNDGSSKIVDIPVEVIGPFIVDEGPVKLGEKINPLDRVSNIPRGWDPYHTLTATTDTLGKQKGKNRNQVNFRAPGITTVILRYWLEVVEDTIQVEFAFVSESKRALDDELMALLPSSYKAKDLEIINQPSLSKKRVDLEDGHWVFKGWKRRDDLESRQKKVKFIGYWAFIPKEEAEKPKSITFWPMDIEPTSKEEEIESIKIHKAYIKGYTDGTFRPENNLSRAEGVAMIARLEGLRVLENRSRFFVDVPLNHWAKDYIYAFYQKGKVTGYQDKTFKPNADITRAEFLQLVMNFVDYKGPNPSSGLKDIDGHWAQDLIHAAYHLNIVKGLPDGTFRPDEKLTRAEAVTILNASYRRTDLMNKGGEILKKNSFDDIDGHWAKKEIVLAASDIWQKK